jgi:hypothetical protein
MAVHTLEATLHGKTETVTMDGMPDDFAATMYAVDIIMDKAYADKTGPWALGAITLKAPDGEVIHTMDAK